MDPNDYTAQISMAAMNAADQQRRISAAQQAHMAQSMMNQAHSLNGAQGMGAINQVWQGNTVSTFKPAPRLHVEVDVVTNGFVLAVGNERMIATSLEELSQQFIAQVANLLLDKDK